MVCIGRPTTTPLFFQMLFAHVLFYERTHRIPHFYRRFPSWCNCPPGCTVLMLSKLPQVAATHIPGWFWRSYPFLSTDSSTFHTHSPSSALDRFDSSMDTPAEGILNAWCTNWKRKSSLSMHHLLYCGIGVSFGLQMLPQDVQAIMHGLYAQSDMIIMHDQPW